MGRQVVTLNQSMRSQELSHTTSVLIMNVFSIVGTKSQAILATFVTIIEL